jgi:FkbM family methyltransferase
MTETGSADVDRGYVRGSLGFLRRSRKSLGLPATFLMAIALAWRRLPKWLPGQGRLVSLRLRGAPHPLAIRVGSSDAQVVRQIFDQCAYRGVAEGLGPAPFIVDLGANIGCSAFWFLWKRPDARVLCVELDQANSQLCQRNLAPFGESASVVRAAVWSSAAPLCVRHAGRGNEWAVSVRRAEPGEPADLMGVTVEDALGPQGGRPIDLMKIDIEGAEVEVMSAPGTWLGRTRNLVMELHSARAHSLLDQALDGFDHAEIETQGELTIVRHLRPYQAQDSRDLHDPENRRRKPHDAGG